MEIRLQWELAGQLQRKTIAITMRTPGYDFELAAGFLFSEGIIGSREDFVDINYCLDEAEENAQNIVTVTLRPGMTIEPARHERGFLANSSCGICGRAALDDLADRGCRPLPDGGEIDSEVISRLPDALRSGQRIFHQTGGLHACGVTDFAGRLVAAREDVGRHNALDKVIGERLILGETPLRDRVLVLSGRAGYEMVQKAVVAGCPIVVAVGAPSSLAVDLAERFNITLLGFVRANGFNVYSAPERIRS